MIKNLNVSNEAADQNFIVLSRKYGMNPLFLKEILRLRSVGFNNTEIAARTGIARNTVNAYLEILQKNEGDPEIIHLIVLGLALFLGFKMLEELFGKREQK